MPVEIQSRHSSVVLLVVMAAVAALYWPGLNGPAMLDDRGALAAFMAADGVPSDWKAYVVSNSGPLGRPISMLSFLANMALGGNSLWSWKATNLAFHLALGWALVLTCNTLTRTAGLRPPVGTVLSLVVASIWLVHPVHVSTVLYTVQRMTQLAALFTLLGIIVYLAARVDVKFPRRARLGLLSVYLIFLPLASLSKETGLLLPAYILVLEFTVLRNERYDQNRVIAHCLLVIFLVVPVLVGLAILVSNFESGIWQAHLRRGITLWERLLTETRVVVRYIVQVIAPTREGLGFFHDDLVVSKGLFAPLSTAMSLLVLAGLAGWSVRNARRFPLICCGILWFLVGHSLEGTIIPLELMFEHRNYLPTAGLLIALGGILVQVNARLRIGLTTVLLGTLIASLSVVTRTIVNDWSSEASLVVAAYRAHPRSERATSLFASMLANHGQFDEARAVLGGLRGAGAEIQRWHIQCQQRGELPDQMLSVAAITREPMLSSYAFFGLTELAKLGLDGKCRFSDVRFREVLASSVAHPMGVVPDRQKLWVYAAHYAWRLDDRTSAFALLERALELQPEDPIPAFLLGEWSIETGDRQRAVAAFERGKRIAETSGRDYSATIASMRALIGYDSEGL
ncbi:MAG: tetratricopeptide repeat protein [Gammaproteobacteria bacterium]